jgi:hypothetical protein
MFDILFDKKKIGKVLFVFFDKLDRLKTSDYSQKEVSFQISEYVNGGAENILSLR